MIDLALCISLFTHLDFVKALEILTTIYHALRNNGRAVVTLFILDAGVLRDIEGQRAAFSFKHRTPSGKLFAEKTDDPTFAVAYDMKRLDELIASAGFQLEHRVTGYWSTGVPGEMYQDALILRKTQTTPAPALT
jgi:hypothetical protein